MTLGCRARAQLDDGTPNYGLGVFLALAVACTAVWASLAGQLVRTFRTAPAPWSPPAAAPPAPPAAKPCAPKACAAWFPAPAPSKAAPSPEKVPPCCSSFLLTRLLVCLALPSARSPPSCPWPLFVPAVHVTAVKRASW